MSNQATKLPSIYVTVPSTLEGINASFKARLTHVNVNYRYIDQEQIYLLDNSDVTVVIYQSVFQAQVDQIRHNSKIILSDRFS